MRQAKNQGPFHRSYHHSHYLHPSDQRLVDHTTEEPVVQYFTALPSNLCSRINTLAVLRHQQKGNYCPQQDFSEDVEYIQQGWGGENGAGTVEPAAPQIHIAWLHAAEQERPKINSLIARMTDYGMHVKVSMIGMQKPLQCFDSTAFDLIFFECVETVEPEMLDQLSAVRLTTQAPLVVLTDNHTLDWGLNALRSGADATFTLNTPEEVILARCNALLRRWVSSHVPFDT
ncbi:MAG: hypothetical protein R3C14_01285 [Caldilineaceae bacterium]